MSEYGASPEFKAAEHAYTNASEIFQAALRKEIDRRAISGYPTIARMETNYYESEYSHSMVVSVLGIYDADGNPLHDEDGHDDGDFDDAVESLIAWLFELEGNDRGTEYLVATGNEEG